MNGCTISFAVLDCCAALLVAHMVWYAFTGDGIVVVEDMNVIRATLLAFVHVMVPMAAILRRAT